VSLKRSEMKTKNIKIDFSGLSDNINTFIKRHGSISVESLKILFDDYSEMQEQEEQSKGIGRIMSNPKECGYRSRNPYLIDDTFSCLNPKDKNTVCNDTEKFPDNCPLQAYRTEGLREELIKLLKDEQVENTYGVEEIEDIVDKYLSSGK
jgi:hypothetical protein